MTPEQLAGLNATLAGADSSLTDRISAALLDPRLHVSAPAPPPPESQSLMNLLGSDVRNPASIGMWWVQQQPWYQSIVNNPWAQGLAGAYMLSRGQVPWVQTDIPLP